MMTLLRDGFMMVPAGVREPVIFAAGVALLLLGGRMLVSGGVHIARRLGLSPMFIGLTVVAFGSSVPELSFNIGAALAHQSDLAFGNIVGSNMANLGLVLAVGAMLDPIVAHSRILVRELPWLAACSAAMLVLGWLPPDVPDALAPKHGYARADGILMLAMLAFFVITWIRLARKDANDPLIAQATATLVEMKERPLALAVALALLGAVLLAVGANVTQSAAAQMARLMDVSDHLAGLTLVAVCTTLPELTVAIVAASRRQSDLLLGSVIGSCIFNLLLVFAVTCVIEPTAVPPRGGWYDLAMLLGMTVFLWPVCTSRSRTVGRSAGLVLLVVYASYLSWRTLLEMN